MIAGAKAAGGGPETGLANRPLRGLPVGVEGHLRHRRFPDRVRHADLCGQSPARRRRPGRADPPRGRHRARQDGDDRACLPQPEQDAQPARSVAPRPAAPRRARAAGVAAGMLPIAVGSQTGGSVIRPAAYCGVTGFDQSYRLLPTPGLKHFAVYLDTAGLFAAGVADVAFDGRRDHGARPARRSRGERGAAHRDRAHQCVGPGERRRYSRRARCTPPRAAEKAGAHGRIIEPAWPAFLTDAFHAHAVIQDYEAFPHARVRIRSPSRSPEPGAARHARQRRPPSRPTTTTRRGARPAARARRLRTSWARSTRCSRHRRQAPAPHAQDTTGPAIFNRVWTLMGTPCVNVTGLKDARGLPLGVQIVGQFGRDREALLRRRIFGARDCAQVSGV